MIIFFLLALPFVLLNNVLAILPCGAYASDCTSPLLPIPVSGINALNTLGEGIGWLIYLPGQTFGDAVLDGVHITIGILIFMYLWKAVSNFRAPIIQRFTHGSEYHDV